MGIKVGLAFSLFLLLGVTLPASASASASYREVLGEGAESLGALSGIHPWARARFVSYDSFEEVANEFEARALAGAGSRTGGGRGGRALEGVDVNSVRSDPANPLGTVACPAGVVRRVSDVPLTRVTPTGVRNETLTATFWMDSTAGGCVRDTGSIVSKRVDSEGNVGASVPLDIRGHPPVYVYKSTPVAFVPERAQEFITGFCNLSPEDMLAFDLLVDSIITNSTSSSGRRLALRASARRLQTQAASQEEDSSTTTTGAGAGAVAIFPELIPFHEAMLQELTTESLVAHLTSRGTSGSGSGGRSGGAGGGRSYTWEPPRDEYVSPKAGSREAALQTVVTSMLETFTLRASTVAAAARWAADPPLHLYHLLIYEVSKDLAAFDILHSAAAAAAAAGSGAGSGSGAGNGTHSEHVARLLSDAGFPLLEPRISLGDALSRGTRTDEETHKRRLFLPLVPLVMMGLSGGAMAGLAAALGLGVAGTTMGALALSQIAGLEDKMTALDTNMGVLKGNIQTNADNIKALQESHNQLQSTVQDVDTRLQTHIKETSTTVAALSKSMAANQGLINSLTGTITAVAAATGAVNTRVDAVAESVEHLQEEAERRDALVDDAFKQQTAALLATQTAIGDLATTAAGWVNNLAADVAVDMDRLRTYTGGVGDALKGHMSDSDVAMRASTLNIKTIQRELFEIIRIMWDLNHHASDRRRLATAVWALRENVETFGWRVLLTEASRLPGGVVPRIAAKYLVKGSPWRRLEVDTFSVVTQGGDGSLVYTSYTLVCDAGLLVGETAPGARPEAILSFLGTNTTRSFPPRMTFEAWDLLYGVGGSAGSWPGTTIPSAVCAIEKSNQTCTPGSTPLSPIDTASIPSARVAERALTKDGLSALCGAQGGIYTAPQAVPTTLFGLSAFLGELQDACTGEETDLTPVLLVSSRRSGPVTGPRGVVVYSLRRAPAPTCELTALGPRSALGRANLMDMFTDLLLSSWSAALVELDVQDISMTGSLSEEVQVTSSPFNYYPFNAKTYSCTYGSLIGLQGAFQPVYSLEPAVPGVIGRSEWFMPSVSRNESTREIGTAAVIGSSGSPMYEVPMAHVLPGGLRIVGNPACWATPCTPPKEGIWTSAPPDTTARYLYDIPITSLPLANSSAARAGSSLYLADFRTATLARNPTTGLLAGRDPTYDFGLDDWSAQNSHAFFENGDVVSIHEYLSLTAPVPSSVSHGPADVRCVRPRGGVFNDLCILLEHFYPVLPDLSGSEAYLVGTVAEGCADPTSGTLCFSPRVWSSQTFNVELPMGTLEQTLASICPTLSTAEFAIGTGAVLLTNPSTYSIETSVRWVWTGKRGGDIFDISGVSTPIELDTLYADTCMNSVDLELGTIAPHASINVPFDSPCASWRLEVLVKDGAAGAKRLCTSVEVNTTLARSAAAIISGVQFNTDIVFAGSSAVAAKLEQVSTNVGDMAAGLEVFYSNLLLMTTVLGVDPGLLNFTLPGGNADPEAYLARLAELQNKTKTEAEESAAARARERAKAAAQHVADKAATDAATDAATAALDAAKTRVTALEEQLKDYNNVTAGLLIILEGVQARLTALGNYTAFNATMLILKDLDWSGWLDNIMDEREDKKKDGACGDGTWVDWIDPFGWARAAVDAIGIGAIGDAISSVAGFFGADDFETGLCKTLRIVFAIPIDAVLLGIIACVAPILLPPLITLVKALSSCCLSPFRAMARTRTAARRRNEENQARARDALVYRSVQDPNDGDGEVTSLLDGRHRPSSEHHPV